MLSQVEGDGHDYRRLAQLAPQEHLPARQQQRRLRNLEPLCRIPDRVNGGTRQRLDEVFSAVVITSGWTFGRQVVGGKDLWSDACLAQKAEASATREPFCSEVSHAAMSAYCITPSTAALGVPV